MGRTRYKTDSQEIPLRRLPAAALRAVLQEGYGASDLRADVLAGLVVGVVALPLAMALAIGAGAPPQNGLYTAIVAGFVSALLGGSRTQVSGPTAAFIVILAPISARFGLQGLLLSGLLGGVLLTAMGLLRLGKLIEFIPYPVTTGFTAGIATVIATLQLKDFLGLRPESNPDHYFERLAAFWQARGTASGWELLVGAATLAMLLGFPKITRKIPSPLLALPIGAVLAIALDHLFGAQVATIAGRFHSTVGGREIAGIPQLPPLPLLPWNAPAAAGAASLPLSFETLRLLLPGAFAVAMLGAIESLLSAVVADGMVQTRHDPDAELLAQGVGNILCPFFGGIPATGAIARTATNIRSGGRSPIAAMVHALTVLSAVLLLAPLVGFLPMASLAALLLLVAWNMAEAKHFLRIVRIAPKSDVAVLLTCYGLTVAIDMVFAVSAGVVLAALLFMRRMAEVTGARLADAEALEITGPLPAGVVVYDIAGPLFFGAAQKAMGALEITSENVQAVILRMEHVPAIDASGLVALESALADLWKHGRLAVLSGLSPQPARALAKANFQEIPGKFLLRPDFPSALEAARAYLKK